MAPPSPTWNTARHIGGGGKGCTTSRQDGGDIMRVLRAGASDVVAHSPLSLDAKARAVLATLRRKTKGTKDERTALGS